MEKAFKITEENEIYTAFQNYVEDRKTLKKVLEKLTETTGIKNYVCMGNYIVSVKKEELTKEALELYESSIKTEDKKFKGFNKIRNNSKLDKYIEQVKKDFGYKGIWFDVAFYFDLAGRGQYVRSIITSEDLKIEEKCFWLKIQLVDGGEIKLDKRINSNGIEEIKLSEWYLLLEKLNKIKENK